MYLLTEDEINKYLSEIDECFDRGDKAAIFPIAKKLNDGTGGKRAYFLGCCYLNGWGTEEDLSKAEYYFKKAVDSGDTYKYSTYLLGIVYYRKSDYNNAIPCFKESKNAGNSGATVLLADSAAAIAFNTWDVVRNCVLQDEISQGVNVVKEYITIAQSSYIEAVYTAPDSMTNAYWCGFGRLSLLLYNLSTLGYLNLDIVTDNSFMTLLSEGASMAQAKSDHDAHYKVFRQGIAACDFMASKGAVLVAEYFRAYLALLESERHHSAEAFFRARWHMKRIGELRNTMDREEAEEVASTLRDMDDKYRVLDKKYGGAVLSMIRQGKRPFIAESYGEGLAPAVESCQNFMQLYQIPQQNTAPKAEKKGFFAKLFGK